MKMFIFSRWWIPGKLCCNTRDSTTQFQDPRLKWKIKGNTQNPIINQNDNLYLLNWKKIKWTRDAEGYKLSVVVSVHRIRIIKNCIANYTFSKGMMTNQHPAGFPQTAFRAQNQFISQPNTAWGKNETEYLSQYSDSKIDSAIVFILKSHPLLHTHQQTESIKIHNVHLRNTKEQ